MKRALAIFLLVICNWYVPFSAKAATWEYIGSSDTGDKCYIDTASISHISNTAKEVWVKYEFSHPNCNVDFAQRLNKCISHFLSYERYYRDKSDCALRLVFYFTDGTNDGGNSLSCKPQKIAPDSTSDIVWEKLFK